MVRLLLILYIPIDEITVFFLEKSDFILWIETVVAAPALYKLNRNQILYYKSTILFGLWVINVSTSKTSSVLILLIS